MISNMRVYIGVLFVATLLSSGYCQFDAMMKNPALMMAMMKGMGGGGGGGGMPMGGMDMSSAPIMDPKMFQMAKLASMMGPKPMAGKGKAAKPTLKMTKPAPEPQSSGIDPMLMMMMMKQNGMKMNPLMMSLLMTPPSPNPAAPETASSGMDPATMYMLMQSGMMG